MLNTDHKIALSITEAAEIADTNRDRIYAAIKSEELKAKRHGRRTLILRSALESYLAALPDIHPEDLKPPITRTVPRRGRGKRRLNPPDSGSAAEHEAGPR
jgi:excisionase family DNA binding protein